MEVSNSSFARSSDSTFVEVNSAKSSQPSDTSQLCDPVLPVKPTGQEEKSSSSSHPPFKDFSLALGVNNSSLVRSSERGPSPSSLHAINNSPFPSVKQLSERSPRQQSSSRVKRPEQGISASSRSHSPFKSVIPAQVSSRNLGTSVPRGNIKEEATDAPT